MKLLSVLIGLCSLSGILKAEPADAPRPSVRTELDEVLEEQSRRPSFPRLDAFPNSPHLSDFPRLGRPYSPPPGIYDHYYYYGGSYGYPRPSIQPRRSQVNQNGWNKVHKHRGEIEIVNGSPVIVQEDSSTTNVAGVHVPHWANWWRFGADGRVEFSQ